MDKLKELFSRKKLSRQFAKSGPGYRLNEESSGKSISKEQTHGSSASNSSSKSNSVDARKDPPRLSAAEAAQKRAQEAQQQNQKTTVKMISYKNYPKLENDKNAEPSSSILPEKSSTNETLPKEKPPENEYDRHTFNCPALDLTEYLPYKELLSKMEDKIKTEFSGLPLIVGALLIRNCNPDEKANVCLSTLDLVLNNMRTDDPEKWNKFKRIRKAKIEQKILSCNGGQTFLEAAGFTLEPDNEWFVFNGSMESTPEWVDECLDILNSSDKCLIQVNRNSKAIDLSKVNIPNEELDDAFFQLAPEELSKEQRARRLAIERQQTFMTREMRAKYEPQKTHTVTQFTRIRFKMLNGRMVEATFYTKETIMDLLKFLESHHELESAKGFDVICGTEAIPVENWPKSFRENGLYPTATLYQRVTSE